MDLRTIIKPEVLHIKGYHLAKRASEIKLDQNENPFGYPEVLKAELCERIRNLDFGRYPDFQMERLTERVAEFVGLPVEAVLVGSGSNSLIQALLTVTVSPRDRVIVPEPTFTLYGLFSKMLGAEVLACRLRPEDFSLPMDELLAATKVGDAKLLVLCSPNNPTGNAYASADIERLLEVFPGLVVIDEAYQEFSKQDAKPLLQTHENLVILRTFSKAMALAGLRIGYMLANPAICAEVRKARLPYSVTLLSETAVLLALENMAVFENAMREIISERDRLWRELHALPAIRVYPSDANFFLVCAADGAALFQYLLDAGILVRDVSGYPGLENCLRISVGTVGQNDRLLARLRRWQSGANDPDLFGTAQR